jgi:polyhydroxybutyrate depolymerase
MRACAAALAALAMLPAAGCSLTHASAQSHTASTPDRSTAKPAARQATRALPPGTRHLTVAGRSYLLYVPPSVRRPAPLVVFLGGIGSTAQSEVALFRATPTAKRARALVAYPEPINKTWNAGGCCWGARHDDVAFLAKMRTAIAAMVPLDPARQVLIGYSNGGMLAYEEACADRHWTAIVAFGASLTTRCTPTHAFSITNVNGTLDDVAPWNGGWSTYARATMPPVWKIDAEFAQAFHCGPARKTTSGADPIYTFSGCVQGVYVRDIRVPGLRHHWPTKQQDGYDVGPILWRLAGV